MITTKNVNSTGIKEKKSKSSTNRKQNRKVDLKKEDLLALLARFEGELQGKEIAIAALKVKRTFELKRKIFFSFQSQQIRILLSNHRFTLFTSKIDPHAALLRDSERIHDDVQNEYELVRKCQNVETRRLTELVAQQRNEIETLRRFIDEGQRKYSKVKRGKIFVFIPIRFDFDVLASSTIGKRTKESWPFSNFTTKVFVVRRRKNSIKKRSESIDKVSIEMKPKQREF